LGLYNDLSYFEVVMKSIPISGMRNTFLMRILDPYQFEAPPRDLMDTLGSIKKKSGINGKDRIRPFEKNPRKGEEMIVKGEMEIQE
jgi:hypothetical protein